MPTAYLPTMPDVLIALSKFIHQRPGLDPANYISDWRDVDGRRAYMADLRRIARQRADALELWHYVQTIPVTAGDVIEQSRGQRLTIEPTETGIKLDYCTGQYWPTEYRAAAARLLASTAWAYWRDHCGLSADDMRAFAREYFGLGLARRWFN